MSPTEGVSLTNTQIAALLRSHGIAAAAAADSGGGGGGGAGTDRDDRGQQLIITTPLARGFNNRLYAIRVLASAAGEHQDQTLILKVGGRHWVRRKTECEVAALRLIAEAAGGAIPVPRVIAWSAGAPRTTSDSVHIPHEYILMTHMPGAPLDTRWDRLSSAAREHVIDQLAAIVRVYRSIRLPTNNDNNGNDSVVGNLGLAGYDREMDTDVDVVHRGNIIVTQTHDGPGPFASSIEYIIDTLADQLSIIDSRASPAPAAAAAAAEEEEADPSSVPRVSIPVRRLHETLSADAHEILRRLSALSLTSDGREILTTRVFTPPPSPMLCHGDFAFRNILIDDADEEKRERPSITAILDWEWCGFFPAHVDISSFDFLDPEISQHKPLDAALIKRFWDGVHLPTTQPHGVNDDDDDQQDMDAMARCSKTFRLLMDVAENCAHWYYRDVRPGEETPEDLQGVEAVIAKARAALDALLSKIPSL